MKGSGSKVLKKLLIPGLAVGLLLCVTIGTGLGGWIYSTETTSDSAPADYKADPIEENAVFADGYDYAMTGARSYDVYFMSQMCNVTEHILTDTGNTVTVDKLPGLNAADQTITTGTAENYTLNAHPVPYYTETEADVATYDADKDVKPSTTDTSGYRNTTCPADYGMWLQSDGVTPLTSNINSDKNRYFIRYQSVKELSPATIAAMGHPYFNLDDRAGWPLNFLCWTPLYNLPVYYNYYSIGTSAIEGEQTTTLFPEMTTRQVDHNGTTYEDENGNEVARDPADIVYKRRVTGYAPYSSTFTSLYSGTLLEYYERLSADGISYTPITTGTSMNLNYCWYVNGRPSIFFFPVYSSSAKNYISTSQYKETFAWNNNGTREYFNYDGVYTDAVNKACNIDMDTDPTIWYECYRISRRRFYTGRNYYIETAPNRHVGSAGWADSWYTLFTQYPQLVEGDYINMYLITKINTSATDSSDVIISADDYTLIDEGLETLGVSKYYDRGKSIDLSKMGTEIGLSSTEGRDYYIVYERVYTPKLTGGPLGDVRYDNNSYDFIKQGVDVTKRDNLIQRNIALYGDEMYEYEYTYTNANGETFTVNVHYPSTYFGVLMTTPEAMVEEQFDYDLVAVEESTYANRPTINTSGSSGGHDSNFYSNDIFVESLSTDNDHYTKTVAEAKEAEAAGKGYIPYVEVTDSTGVTTEMNLEAANEQITTTVTTDGVASEVTSSKYGLHENWNMIRVREGEEGVYTILFQKQFTEVEQDFEYTTSTGGTGTVVITRHMPTTLVMWGFSFSDKFINICDISGYTDEQLLTSSNPLQYRATTDDHYYINTNSFSWCSTEFAYGTILDEEVMFYTYENAQQKLDGVTLLSILQDMEQDPNKEMVDLVSGRIITSSNYTQFVVERYYVFVIKLKSQEIVVYEPTVVSSTI